MKKHLKTIALLVIFSIIVALLPLSTQAQAKSKTTTKKETQEKKTKKTETEKKIENYLAKGKSFLFSLNGEQPDLYKARKYFKKAAKLGSDEANFYLGALLDFYYFPKLNFELAREYYEKAADLQQAKVALGFLYYFGDGVETDEVKAVELWKEVIESGYSDGFLGMGAYYASINDYTKAHQCYMKVANESTEELFKYFACESLAYDYLNGNGTEIDYEKAYEYSSKAAEGNVPNAFGVLGSMYLEGIFVEQDIEKGLEYLKLAASNRSEQYAFLLGLYYFNGFYVDKNDYIALNWFKKADKLGNINALDFLGMLYYYGKGVEKDSNKAKEYFERAIKANENDVDAYLALGYINVQDEDPDIEKAIEYFEKAAGYGDEIAMYYLSWIYSELEDYDTAVMWLRKAAYKKLPTAMNELGKYYFNGYGVKKDLYLALNWTERAVKAEPENEDFQKQLDEIKAAILDMISKID